MDKGMERDGEMTEKIAQGDSSDKITSTLSDSGSKLILPPKKQYMHSRFKPITSCCEQLPILEWQSNSSVIGINLQAQGSSRDPQQSFPARQQTNIDTTMSTQKHDNEIGVGYQYEVTAQIFCVDRDSKDDVVFKKPTGRAPKRRQKLSSVKRPTSKVEETSPLPSSLAASGLDRMSRNEKLLLNPAISGESSRQQQQQEREPIRQSVSVFSKKTDPTVVTLDAD